MPTLCRHDLERTGRIHVKAREFRRTGTLQSAHSFSWKVKPLFPLGQVVATSAALAAIEKAGQQPGEFLTRHVNGDWGDLDPHDLQEN